MCYMFVRRGGAYLDSGTTLGAHERGAVQQFRGGVELLRPPLPIRHVHAREQVKPGEVFAQALKRSGLVA